MAVDLPFYPATACLDEAAPLLHVIAELRRRADVVGFPRNLFPDEGGVLRQAPQAGVLEEIRAYILALAPRFVDWEYPYQARNYAGFPRSLTRERIARSDHPLMVLPVHGMSFDGESVARYRAFLSDCLYWLDRMRYVDVSENAWSSGMRTFRTSEPPEAYPGPHALNRVHVHAYFVDEDGFGLRVINSGWPDDVNVPNPAPYHAALRLLAVPDSEYMRSRHYQYSYYNELGDGESVYRSEAELLDPQAGARVWAPINVESSTIFAFEFDEDGEPWRWKVQSDGYQVRYANEDPGDRVRYAEYSDEVERGFPYSRNYEHVGYGRSGGKLGEERASPLDGIAQGDGVVEAHGVLALNVPTPSLDDIYGLLSVDTPSRPTASGSVSVEWDIGVDTYTKLVAVLDYGSPFGSVEGESDDE